MAGYKVFTAAEALKMAQKGYTEEELAEAVNREHERIRKAANDGRRSCAAYMTWLTSRGNALACEVRRILENEGYEIYNESTVSGGVRQEPYPYIHW